MLVLTHSNSQRDSHWDSHRIASANPAAASVKPASPAQPPHATQTVCRPNYETIHRPAYAAIVAGEQTGAVANVHASRAERSASTATTRIAQPVECPTYAATVSAEPTGAATVPKVRSASTNRTVQTVSCRIAKTVGSARIANTARRNDDDDVVDHKSENENKNRKEKEKEKEHEGERKGKDKGDADVGLASDGDADTLRHRRHPSACQQGRPPANQRRRT